jgi:acetoin utilization protein AcuB
MLSIADVMKRNVLTAERDESIRAALARMQAAGIRHLPVVDGAHRLVGVVTDRDLMRAAGIMETADGKRGRLHVGDIMHADGLRVRRELPAYEAASMMIENKIGMLPVVDEDDVVCGIVTATDFLEVAREALLGVDPNLRAEA